MPDWKQQLRKLKKKKRMLSSCKDSRVPWYARALAVVAYALSPIDLIPDVTSVIYLDDLILVPWG